MEEDSFLRYGGTHHTSLVINNRNSVDKKSNARGKKLMEFCKNNEISIMNGRTLGDLFGELTCTRWTGCIVVDYGMCSHSLLNHLIHFSIQPPLPWLSDHSAISFEVSFPKFKTKSLEGELKEAPRLPHRPSCSRRF